MSKSKTCGSGESQETGVSCCKQILSSGSDKGDVENLGLGLIKVLLSLTLTSAFLVDLEF